MSPMTSSTNGQGSTPNRQKIQSDVRLYGNRASYDLPAALSILRENPVCHVAFVHPGDGDRREETVMNIPLITVAMPDPDVPEEEADEGEESSWALYLHTHKQSGLVEAVQSGVKSLTASTIHIDGMILSPWAHDHSLNYRSATFHLHNLKILPDEGDPQAHEEKRAALAQVTNTVVGYERTETVGQPTDPNVRRTTVLKCKVKAISCKQRYGAFDSGKEPVFQGPAEDAFTGVVPCWTSWGKPLGYGKDAKAVQEHFEKRTEDGKRLADGVAWASESASLEGLGRKRKPKH